MNHNECTCAGCMTARALTAERKLAEAMEENERLRSALALARDELTGSFSGSWGHTMDVINAALTNMPTNQGE